jgi:hypothetical protein
MLQIRLLPENKSVLGWPLVTDGEKAKLMGENKAKSSEKDIMECF